MFKYIACGESVDKLIVVHASGFSDLLATPFATKSGPLANSVIIDWALEQKEQLRTLSHLKEDITVLTRTKTYRIADEPMPVLFSQRYFYQLGPFHPELVSVSIGISLRITNS